jgi:putative flippase GtrA
LVASERLQSLRRSALAARITRYAVGSVFALLTSVVVFAVLYVMGVGTTACSICAFVAGAVPNWVLNRKWAWRMQGSVAWGREIIGYIAVSILALVASSAGTALAQNWVEDHVPPGHGIRVILVTGAYVAVQGILFVLKFLVYEHWVFSGRSRLRAALRSRHQVWTAARAERAHADS